MASHEQGSSSWDVYVSRLHRGVSARTAVCTVEDCIVPSGILDVLSALVHTCGIADENDGW